MTKEIKEFDESLLIQFPFEMFMKIFSYLSNNNELILISKGFYNAIICSFKSLKMKTKITDNGISHLSTLINLKTLILTYCEIITDNGLSYLSKLINLNRLYLYECYKITDDGLSYLSTLINLNQSRIYI